MTARHALVLAVLIFLSIVWLGERLVQNYVKNIVESHRFATITYASNIRARLESQLNSVLFLSSGLSSYLVVRNNTMQSDEIRDILKTLHGSNPLVKNFGIAVGYRLQYVYPVEGNESAVGLYYPDQKNQWPAIKKVIDEGKPVLAGPLTLVQGGKGLIYRSPIFIGDRYWGLLSTVINSDTLFESLRDSMSNRTIEFAIRREGEENSNMAVWGDQTIFAAPDVALQKIEIPGGVWTVAARHIDDDKPPQFFLFARLSVYVIAALASWAIYSIILSRINLAELALYDRLTGLPNRHLLQEQAKLAFHRQDRSPDRVCAILFIDLDGFKEINDKHGHKAGDTALRIAASRGKSVLRTSDMMARWGGDEFIVLLEGASREEIEVAKQRLRSAIEPPFEHEGIALRVGASIGVACYPEAGTTLDEILRAADKQMYADKSARKNTARQST